MAAFFSRAAEERLSARGRMGADVDVDVSVVPLLGPAVMAGADGVEAGEVQAMMDSLGVGRSGLKDALARAACSAGTLGSAGDGR